MKYSELELPSNRKFGFFFAAVFLALGLYLWGDGTSNYNYFAWALSAGFFLVTLIKADLLLPLNKLWMRLGLLIGMVVSPIVLGIIFFCMFTPVSLLMKLFGRDELRLKMNSRQSHWKQRNSDVAATHAFKNQF